MRSDSIDRDERTIAVENESYRWGYLVLTFGLLAIVAFRGFARGESSWDLLILIGVAAAVTTIYQKRHWVLTRRWLLTGILALALAAVLGFLTSRMR